MNADGSEPRQLTESEGMKDFPSWSPDGKRIAFIHARNFIGISVIDVSGTNLRQLTTPSLMDSHPSWSPDGQYIAYGSRVDVDKKVRRIGHSEIL